MDWLGRTPWQHQDDGAMATIAAVAAGERRVCVTSPTGGGKTLLMAALINHYLEQQKRAVLYTNRRMLMDQTIKVMQKFGIGFGVRASGRDDLADQSQRFQLSMLQTEQTRSRRRAMHFLHNADVAFVDEAHNAATGGNEDVLNAHLSEGAAVIGFTATPLGIGHLYTHLVTAGVNSELRKCGAHVSCYVYGPDEPAAALNLKRTKTGEFTEAAVVKAIMSPTIFGRVLEWYGKLNPERRPSILFAPGVKESIWFAEQFKAAGVRAAHIDGETIWIDGEAHRSTQELRDEVLAESKSGKVQVLCNRFVLREGIDAPWLYHGILATVFGSVTSYIQSVGRLLRSHPGLDRVVLQDHGGNWWRHGSPNADREWDLSLDANRYSAEREQRMRDKKEDEPIVCPKCGAVRLRGPKCVTCGHEASAKMRPVLQTDGTLRMMRGDIYKNPKTDLRTTTEKEWQSIYWPFRKSDKTFSQAYGYFIHQHGYAPPKTLPLMPKSSVDWHAKIADVPYSELHQRQEGA